jgi:hypothetical protein
MRLASYIFFVVGLRMGGQPLHYCGIGLKDSVINMFGLTTGIGLLVIAGVMRRLPTK